MTRISRIGERSGSRACFSSLAETTCTSLLPSQRDLLSRKSLSSIPAFLSAADRPAVASLPYLNLCKSAQSADSLSLRILRVLCGEITSYFGEAAETCTRRLRARLRRPRSRVCSVDPCHPWLSAASFIRVYSCPFVVWSENLKKFSLNPVEGISTSDLNVQPSTEERATATTDYTDRTDAQTQKEQVRFMKITQNAENLEQKETKLTRAFGFPGP